MFGHHDDNQPADEPQNSDITPEDQPTDSNSAPQPADDTPASSFNDSPQPASASSTPDPAPAGSQPGWSPPSTPVNDKPANDLISPAGGFPKRPTYQYAQGAPAPDAAPASGNPELVEVRDHALEELEPLLDKLDLPPEDKFRAIMMILQAKDDESLVKKAYEAAHSIEDDEVRARALYDIVNEVNYFTQPPEN